jgi:hypothetical protein
MSDIVRTADLQRLPLKALVAIAARAARRVQTTFRPNPNYKLSDQRADLNAIDTAISAAEDTARGRMSLSAVDREVIVICAEIASAATGAPTVDEAMKIDGAARAAIFAMKTADAAISGNRQRAIDSADKALAAARRAFESTDDCCRRDLAELQKICRAGFNEFGDSIDPSPGGPLGPL